MKLTAHVFNSTLSRKNSGHTTVNETSLQRDLCLLVRWEDIQACQMVVAMSIQGAQWRSIIQCPDYSGVI